ncbi:zinc finger matrin-type protein [Wolffia australiana]
MLKVRDGTAVPARSSWAEEQNPRSPDPKSKRGDSMAAIAAISSRLPPQSRFRRSIPSPFPQKSSQRTSPWKRSILISRPSRGNRTAVRVQIPEEAPFAAAIGASILFSLAFPVPGRSGEDADEGSDSGFDFGDTRFAVMAILSLIPYFNWMSWIFAWLDTGRQRYLVYAAVYLAPYIRSNLSISPEESFLPIASILACILHVQLEESIRNGDIDAIKLLDKTLKFLLPGKEKERR